MIADLRSAAAGLSAPLASVDRRVAGVLIDSLERRHTHAEAELFRQLRDDLGNVFRDNETFISFVFGAYSLQRYDLMSAMLRDRFAFSGDLQIHAEENGPGEGRVRWEVTQQGDHRFVFDACSFRYDKTRNDILNLCWSFPLYAAYSRFARREHGAVVINQMDIGFTPGLCWCDNRPEYFLVPDSVFVPTEGYAHARQAFANPKLRWSERKDTAFWRGSTTGIPKKSGDWRSLERVALCELARRHPNEKLFDVGLSAVTQFDNPEDAAAIEASGLMAGYVSWEAWCDYRYLIDIDGNTNAWAALFQKLLTGGTVLKVESYRGLRQWYYQDLRAWESYIPIASDLSDLVDKLKWLRRNPSYAEAVGTAGRKLALEMTFDREIERGVKTIARCFQHFRNGGEQQTPFGLPKEALRLG